MEGPTNLARTGRENVPTYLSQPACGRFYVDSDSQGEVRHPELAGLGSTRSTETATRSGHDQAHEGGDVWAADAAIATMENEKKWSGVFVTLPGVDKAAHMWGSIDDPGAARPCR